MVNGRYLRKAPQVVVICSKFGRLGNRLFVFAHAVAAAIEYNFLLLNPSFEDYADYFEATRGQWLVRYQPGEAPSSDVGALGSIVRHLCYQSANLILRRGVRNRLFASVPLDETQKMDLAGVDFRALLMDTRVLLLSGWLFRAEDLLAKHAEKVRRFFVPYKEHAVRIEKFMADLRKDADVVIGIHIRRGDYKEWRSGRYYFSADQYRDIMSRVVRLFPRKSVIFLLCSDEPIVLEEFASFQVAPGLNHFVEDLYCFSQADYLVGPPSTYTHWASFYGKVPLCTITCADQQISLRSFS